MHGEETFGSRNLCEATERGQRGGRAALRVDEPRRLTIARSREDCARDRCSHIGVTEPCTIVMHPLVRLWARSGLSSGFRLFGDCEKYICDDDLTQFYRGLTEMMGNSLWESYSLTQRFFPASRGPRQQWQSSVFCFKLSSCCIG